MGKAMRLYYKILIVCGITWWCLLCQVHPEDDIVPTDKVHRIVLELLTTERSYVRKLRLLQTVSDGIPFITYEEQLNKGHMYRMISNVWHNKTVCPLSNCVAGDWLSFFSSFF